MPANADRPPLFLVPGAGSAHVPFADTIARFAPLHPVFLVTLAGFAGRPPIEGPLLSRARRALAAHVAAERLERITIVGHSLGGWLALALALDAPEAVREVVLVDAVPSFGHLAMPNATPHQIATAAREREARTRNLASGSASFVRRAFAKMVSDERHLLALGDEAARSDLDTLARAMTELWLEDLRPELPRLAANVTTVVPLAGGLSTARREATIARYAQQWHDVPGHRVVVVTPSRHFVMLDSPESLGAIIDAALRRAHVR